MTNQGESKEGGKTWLMKQRKAVSKPGRKGGGGLSPKERKKRKVYKGHSERGKNLEKFRRMNIAGTPPSQNIRVQLLGEVPR